MFAYEFEQSICGISVDSATDNFTLLPCSWFPSGSSCSSPQGLSISTIPEPLILDPRPSMVYTHWQWSSVVLNSNILEQESNWHASFKTLFDHLGVPSGTDSNNKNHDCWGNKRCWLVNSLRTQAKPVSTTSLKHHLFSLIEIILGHWEISPQKFLSPHISTHNPWHQCLWLINRKHFTWNTGSTSTFNEVNLETRRKRVTIFRLGLGNTKQWSFITL